MLIRLYLSEARFYYCQWLHWRGMRKPRAGLATVRKAETIRRLERLYLGLDVPDPGAARPPSIPRRMGGENA